MSHTTVISKTHIGRDIPLAEALPLILERMWKRTVKSPTGCWLWTGPKVTNGYVELCMQGVRRRLHRYSYEIHKGAIPAGNDVCHSCDVRHCWNPAHLWTGTRKQNVDDMTAKARHWSKVKTVCKHGHPFTPENTEIRQSRGKPGEGRACKTCMRIRQRMLLGWTREQAETLPVTPKGYRPVAMHR